MFEVEPNLWLQSFATPWLTALMQGVSFFGYDWLYAAVVIGLGFGWKLRPMLGVMLALLLAGLCTHATKDGLQLPRPVKVDQRVLDKGHANTRWLVQRGGATAFFALPSSEAIAAQRAAPKRDFGFLSGHVAAATALCTAFLLWRPRRRAVRIALCLWPVLMALSRMYLGRHFLADVLAGAVAGASAAVLARQLWERANPRWLLLVASACSVMSAAWSPLDRITTGQLLGLAVVAMIQARVGWPEGTETRWWQRMLRVAMAFGLYAVIKFALDALADAAKWPDAHLMSIPLAAIGTLGVMTGGVILGWMAGLYGCTTSPAPAG